MRRDEASSRSGSGSVMERLRPLLYISASVERAIFDLLNEVTQREPE
jgi:hypothetical protein